MAVESWEVGFAVVTVSGTCLSLCLAYLVGDLRRRRWARRG